MAGAYPGDAARVTIATTIVNAARFLAFSLARAFTPGGGEINTGLQPLQKG